MSQTPTRPSPEDLANLESLLSHFETIERQFQAVRAGLTHSHRLATLGTLASIVAHEYNNILTPIISYSEMALQRPDDHALLLKAVEKSLSGAQRAAKISSSLLGFAHTGEDEKSAPLRHTIDEAVACLARDPKKDGIELVIDVPDVQLAIAPLNLQQVLLNLFLNARKAMRRTGGTLSVRARRVSANVHIEVEDTGPGIPVAIRERLFEPFVTQPIDGSPQADQRGTGLGLCICRDLMIAAGGSIDVESPPGKGAKFLLCLPIAPANAAAA